MTLRCTNQGLYFCFFVFSRPLNMKGKKFIAAMEILLKWEIIVNCHAITYGRLKRMCKVLYIIPVEGTYIYMPQKLSYFRRILLVVVAGNIHFFRYVYTLTQEQNKPNRTE